MQAYAVCRMPRCIQCQTVPVSVARSIRSRVRYSVFILDGSGIHAYVVGKSKSKHERISGVIGVQVEYHLAIFVHVSSKYIRVPMRARARGGVCPLTGYIAGIRTDENALIEIMYLPARSSNNKRPYTVPSTYCTHNHLYSPGPSTVHCLLRTNYSCFPFFSIPKLPEK